MSNSATSQLYLDQTMQELRQNVKRINMILSTLHDKNIPIAGKAVYAARPSGTLIIKSIEFWIAEEE